MRRHPFQASGMKDVYGRSICGVCDNVRKHRVHDLPEVTQEQREVADRIIGESTSDPVATQGE